MPRLEAPANGVTVRMYRQGHGDCFLLAFPREGGGEPVYVLIDCGLKPGSQNFVHGTKIQQIVDHIGESTGNRLDLMVVTHEHQDHCNGIWKKNDPYFRNLEIEEAWLAWTESDTDPKAIEIRKRHKDVLVGLVEARNQLALAIGDEPDPAVSRLDSLLSLEFGGESNDFDLRGMGFAASDPTKSTNKQALKLVKDKASLNRGVQCLDPGGAALAVPNSQGVKAYVLGPPKDEDLLTDEDPVGDEGFSDGSGSHGLSFSAAAAAAGADEPAASPFRRKYHAIEGPFFLSHYGPPGPLPDPGGIDGEEVPPDAPWRRIDEEWLYSAESLALKLNRGVNNTSLVLAFELPASKKVLLFAGDAQRGNWISWSDCEWDDGDSDKTRDLLSRTVLYKVGHHGSHNATLNGTVDDDYANLAWMGLGTFGAEFTAMITAVNKWAMTKNNPPWRHPLPSIRKALEEKTAGRLFQTDEDQPKKPDSVSDAEWSKFTDRMVCDNDYFDYIVVDGAIGPARRTSPKSRKKTTTKKRATAKKTTKKRPPKKKAIKKKTTKKRKTAKKKPPARKVTKKSAAKKKATKTRSPKKRATKKKATRKTPPKTRTRR